MGACADSVVVTGTGAVTSIGQSTKHFWENLTAGRGGYDVVRAFDTGGQRTSIGCEVKGFDEGRFMPVGAGSAGRATALAVAAASEALGSAGLGPAELAGVPVGVCFGTTMGEIRVLELYVESRVGPGEEESSFAGYPCHMIPEQVARAFGLAGPNLMIPTACAAGNYAIGLGRDMIAGGEAEVMVVGGVDPYSRVAHTGFNRLFSMSPDVCRPFDRERRGIILGEGAGVLVLEGEKRARERGAAILARVLGYGLSNDAHHITNPAPSGEGVVRAMQRALLDAGLRPEDIDYISAHGTGTQANDAAETNAIKKFFGKRAYEVPVSSIKSMIGHTMGAASALEAVASVMCLKTGMVPPTINYENPDPQCDLDYVPNESRACRVRVVLSNSMAFGGNNACLLLGTYPK